MQPKAQNPRNLRAELKGLAPSLGEWVMAALIAIPIGANYNIALDIVERVRDRGQTIEEISQHYRGLHPAVYHSTFLGRDIGFGLVRKYTPCR